MKIAIVGSRGFKDQEFVQAAMNEYMQLMSIFISGGALGVDTWAENWVNEYNKTLIEQGLKELIIKKVVLDADWEKYGKKAGAIRNQKIVDLADRILAFWDGTSKGTKITIDMAIKAKKPIDVFIRG